MVEKQPKFDDKRLSMEQRWVSVRELAELYSMSDTSVRKKVTSGAWPAHRQAAALRFSPHDQARIEDMWKSTWEGRVWTKEDGERVKRLLKSRRHRG